MTPSTIPTAVSRDSISTLTSPSFPEPSTLSGNVIQIADQLITQAAQAQTVANPQPKVSKSQARSFVKAQAKGLGEQARALLPIKSNKLSTIAAINAVNTGNVGMLKALVKYNLVDINQAGQRLLVVAVSNDAFETIDFLVSQARVPLTHMQNHLLKLAVSKGNPQLISHLLHLGQVDVAADDFQALRQAIQAEDHSTISLLLQSPTAYPQGKIPDIPGVRAQVLDLISQNKLPDSFKVNEVLHAEMGQSDVNDALEIRQSRVNVIEDDPAPGNFLGLSELPNTPAATRSTAKAYIYNQIESPRERVELMRDGAHSRTAGLALIKAARSGETSILKALVTHGLVRANPEIGLRALQGAVASGHLENAYYLLSEVGVNAGQDRSSVLTIAANTGNAEMVSLLTRFEGVNVAESDFRPLRLAHEAGNQKMVDALLLTPSTYVEGRIPEISGLRERVLQLIAGNAFPSTFDVENTLHAEMNDPFMRNAMAHRELNL